MNTKHKLFSIWLAGLVSIAFLFGCGKTGALYLPGEESPDKNSSQTESTSRGDD